MSTNTFTLIFLGCDELLASVIIRISISVKYIRYAALVRQIGIAINILQRVYVTA